LLPFVKTLLYKNNTTKPYQFPNKTIKASRRMVVINDLIVNKKNIKIVVFTELFCKLM